MTLPAQNDEDVVCLIVAPHVSPADLTLKLRLLRTSLRHKIVNCKAVDTAWFDVNSDIVTYREQAWTSVSGVKAPSSSTYTNSTAPSVEASNAFSKLSLGGGETRKPGSSSMSAMNSAGSSRQADTILTSGLYRPPRAIVMGDRPESKKADGNESVVENWEDVA